MTQSEAEDRKAKSIEILKTLNIPYIEHLPVIETEAESMRREESEVVERMIAVAITAAKADYDDGYDLGQKMIKHFNAEHYFSPEEAEFIANPNPSMQDRAKFSWRHEITWIMLWAIGIIDKTRPHDKPADVDELADIMHRHGPNGLFEEAKLRPQAELLDVADLIYRQHWAFRNQSLETPDTAPNIELLLSQTRHYALNWLIGYGKQSWDEVTTDT